MVKYELLPVTVIQSNLQLSTHPLPELVHLDDPALSVMIDFEKIAPYTAQLNDTMDNVSHKMNMSGVHFLLVIDHQTHVRGIIGPEDIFGEKPIQLIEECRISHRMVLANMLMIPVSKLIVFDCETIQSARVGHVVKTLSEYKKSYAIVVHSEKNNERIICGIFSASQISKQLHMELDQAIK